MADTDARFSEAKQLYLEKYGDAIVTNTYLKIAVALLAFIGLGLVALNIKTIDTFRNWRPLVIRVDQLGRAQAVDYRSLEYRPADPEAKYFLSEFCRLYYRRNRYTINDDFTKAMYFLDGKLANDIMQQSKQAGTINKFLTNPSAPEVDVEVQDVTLGPMQKPPYHAQVDFYRVEYNPADHSVLKKTLCTASFLYIFRHEVPNDLIPVNPLGLTITYFREDQAFVNAGNEGQQ
jgi:type IV secretory pathway component VirB8